MEGHRARNPIVFHLVLSNTNKMALIKGAVKLVIREKRTAPIIMGASNPGKVSDKMFRLCYVTVVEQQSLTIKLCTTHSYGAEDVQTPESIT